MSSRSFDRVKREFDLAVLSISAMVRALEDKSKSHDVGTYDHSLRMMNDAKIIHSLSRQLVGDAEQLTILSGENDDERNF